MPRGDRRLEIVDQLARATARASFGAAPTVRCDASNQRERVLRADAESRQRPATTQCGGGSSSGNSRSPRSRPSTVPPSRKYGTSAPSVGATARRPSPSSDAPQPRRARAAPPPHRCCRRPAPPASGSASQIDRDVARRAAAARRAPQPRGGARDRGSSRPIGQRRIVARQPKRPAARADRQRVVQRDRLKDRPQLMVPVGCACPSTRSDRLIFANARTRMS